MPLGGIWGGGGGGWALFFYSPYFLWKWVWMLGEVSE